MSFLLFVFLFTVVCGWLDRRVDVPAVTSIKEEDVM